MGIFSLFRNKEEKKTKYTFNDEDREFSKEVRERKKQIELSKLDEEYSLTKLRIEKQKLELQRDIDKIKDEYEDDSDDLPDVSGDNTENELIKMFAPMFLKGMNQPKSSSTSTASETALQNKISYSDAALVSMWDNAPIEAKNYAKLMTDEAILAKLELQLPNADGDSLQRALSIVRGKCAQKA
jgi:hypothetical protein